MLLNLVSKLIIRHAPFVARLRSPPPCSCGNGLTLSRAILHAKHGLPTCAIFWGFCAGLPGIRSALLPRRFNITGALRGHPPSRSYTFTNRVCLYEPGKQRLRRGGGFGSKDCNSSSDGRKWTSSHVQAMQQNNSFGPRCLFVSREQKSCVRQSKKRVMGPSARLKPKKENVNRQVKPLCIS